MTGPEAIIEAAAEQLGAPYVYGAWGDKCTVPLRKKYARLTPSQAETTYKRCDVLSEKRKSCDGCRYQGMNAYDCRGFTHWCLLKAGIDIYGQKVSVQLGTDSNWDARGEIAWMPDLVCCVFLDGHTGLHLGGGRIIHCSGEVKEEQLGSGRKWTKFAIPKGLYTAREILAARKGEIRMETLRRGSSGEAVMTLQLLLNAAGFDCGLADGKFGKKTEEAVRAYQGVMGLPVDGICGPATWKKLTVPDQPELPEDADEIPEGIDGSQLPAEEAETQEDAATVAGTMRDLIAVLEELAGLLRRILGEEDERDA